MKISFEKRFLFIFLLIALCVLAFSIITYRNNNSIAEGNYRVNHTHQVLFRAEKSLSDLKDIETGVRGYIITRDIAFLDPYYHSKDSIITNLEKLSALTADNALQHLRVDTLLALATKRIEQCAVISNIHPGDLEKHSGLLKIVRDGKIVMDKIRLLVTRIEIEENRLLVLRENFNNEIYKKVTTRFYIFFSSILFVFILAYFFVRYNFSILQQDSKILFQLNKRLSFLNKRFDDTIEAVSDPFFALDQNWKFIYVNTAAQKKIGYKKGSLIGKDIFKLFPDYKKISSGRTCMPYCKPSSHFLLKPMMI